MRLLFVFLMCASSVASAQQLLQVPQPVWAGLSQPERDTIQQRYLIEVISPDSFGVIIDTQGVDQSTPGSNSGSNLGAAVGNAAYIDQAFRDGNYSAKGQLGAMLLGGLVGATLDSAPVSRFHYRYAVRTGDGSIRYVDEIGSSPFRHPVGICVALPVIAVLTDQQVCAHNLASFRQAHLGASAVSATPAPIPVATAPVTALSSSAGPRAAVVSPAGLVSCKLNSLAPVQTTAEKCRLINGTPIQ